MPLINFDNIIQVRYASTMLCIKFSMSVSVHVEQSKCEAPIHAKTTAPSKWLVQLVAAYL